MRHQITLPDFSLTGWIIFFIILALPILPNLWSIFHVWRNTYPNPQEKMLWMLCSAMLPLAGGVIYIFIGRPRAIKNPKTEEREEEDSRPPYIPD